MGNLIMERKSTVLLLTLMSILSQAVEAADPTGPVPKAPHVMLNMQEYSKLVAVQAFIWIPILLIIITGCTVCFMLNMDADKEKDTLVYTKFLNKSKDN